MQIEHELLSLPVKNGGLALRDPVATAEECYQTSKAATSVLQAAVRTGLEPSLEEHMMQYKTILQEVRRKAEEARAVKQAAVMEDLPAFQKRTLSRIIKGEASNWLTVLSLASEGFDLSAMQFRDQLAMR